MNPVFEALSRAFRDLFQFKILWVIVWPMLVAMLLWMVLGMVFWSTFSGWIASGLTSIGVQHWLEGFEPRWVANAIQALIHLILFVPLVFVTALIRVVAERDFPQLRRENGGSAMGNLLNADRKSVV